MSKDDKVLARSVHLGLGLDLLGSKMSLSAKAGNELEVIPLGVKATSSKGRVVLIPWANIKGVELMGDAGPSGAPQAAKSLPPKTKPVAKD